MFRITILMSGKHGRGSNMASLADACASGAIPNANVACVVGTHPDSPAIARARELGLPVEIVSTRDPDFDSALVAAIERGSPQLICLAGYMRKLPAQIVAHYRNRILNVHPALLPAFGGAGMYGRHVHEAVLAYGCKMTGCTVHFLDEEFDTGPILLQKCVDVRDDDTVDSLAQRVLAAEHESYRTAVGWIAAGKVRVDGRRVFVDHR